MCGQHNIRATAGDNTGQNTDKGHTPSPRIEIKFSNPTGNRILAAGLEDRDFIDNAAVLKFADIKYCVSGRLAHKGQMGQGHPINFR